MSAREKPDVMPWLDYLMYADPARPYLELFKVLARAAYYALGGDDIDAALDQARVTVDEWVAGRGKPADENTGPRPVGNREAASARNALAKQGEARRRLYERGCETVARLFHDVLKRDAFDRREPSEIDPDAPPPPPVDPALEEAIKARAPNFMAMANPRRRPVTARPGFEPFDEAKQAEMTALAMRNRELEVHLMQMGAMHAGGAIPADAALREPTEPELDAFSLALAEGEDDTILDMPEESREQVKMLQKWFAGHHTTGAPRAAVAAFARKRVNQVFDRETVRAAAKRSIVRLTMPGV